MPTLTADRSTPSTTTVEDRIWSEMETAHNAARIRRAIRSGEVKANATLTTCFATYTHADGSVSVEKMWLLLPRDGQREFLGLVADTTEEAALVVAAKMGFAAKVSL